MAGVTMVGTAPYFYRVLITEALLTAVETVSFPNEETVVLRFIPPVPDMDRMYPMECGLRRIVVSSSNALKLSRRILYVSISHGHVISRCSSELCQAVHSFFDC